MVFFVGEGFRPPGLDVLMHMPGRDYLLEDTEVRLLLEGVLQWYGFDFRDYAPEILKRRLWERIDAEGLRTISGYQEKLLHDEGCLEHLLLALSGTRPCMFHDPGFYQALRTTVVPVLRTYASAQVWLPACSTGEEAYAVAIVFREEGLSQRCRVYATDISEVVLKTAREGLFPLTALQDATANYVKAGGARAFSEYYTVQDDRVVMDAALRESIVFAEHHLATDGSFNEFQVIMCRNAIGLFNEWLQERVHELFLKSLSRFGLLLLGEKENPKLPWNQESYELLEGPHTLYRKMN